jgi:hypothetical protein
LPRTWNSGSIPQTTNATHHLYDERPLRALVRVLCDGVPLDSLNFYIPSSNRHPQELYRLSKDRACKVLNKAVFRRLFLDADEVPYVAADELTEPFTTIL